MEFIWFSPIISLLIFINWPVSQKLEDSNSSLQRQTENIGASYRWRKDTEISYVIRRVM